MTRASCMLLLALSLAAGCDKKDADASTATASSGKAAKAATSASASGEASAEPKGDKAPPKAAKTTVEGAYDAKVGSVRVQEKGPAFVDVPEGAIGAGELTIELPADEGEVNGKASGALGAQSVTGTLEGGHLYATVAPTDVNGEPRFWGLIDATVEGKGDARVVTGTLRETSANARVVREATFKLAKKK